MFKDILQNLTALVQSSNLVSKKYIFEQYDRTVMGDTISTASDAAIVRVHGTKKALALTTDCNPRYVEADAFEGALQAVAETYRNISAVGAKPLAITNCLNFGNPQKPEIMGQIVRAIQGITTACKALDYPVVSGNVSLYNETDGSAIKPTPAIGGVGLFYDYAKRCDLNFKNEDDEIFVVGETYGHIGSSLYEVEILKIENSKNPPKTNLVFEKKNSEFIRNIIATNVINACHDISDGGLLIALFEMCNGNIAFDLDISTLKAFQDIDENHLLFGEDQSRYVITLDKSRLDEFLKLAQEQNIPVFRVGKVINNGKIRMLKNELEVAYLKDLNESFMQKTFFK
jgi:phosphoribosylformylglycinamidine synthase